MDYRFQTFSFGGSTGGFSRSVGDVLFHTDGSGNFSEQPIGTWNTTQAPDQTATISIGAQAGGSGGSTGTSASVTVNNWVITVSSNRSAVPASGGTATITATVTKAGSPFQGHSISFNASGLASPGSCSPTPVTTGANGQAQTTYTSGSYSGTVTITATDTSITPTESATCNITVFRADIDIPDLLEGEEETPGGFVPLNDDDDNHNDTADNAEAASVTGENNLFPISLEVRPDTLPGTDTVTITWTSDAKIDVFEGSDKSNQISSGQQYQVSALPKTLYVEGDQTSAASLRDIEVKLEYTKEGQTSEDKIKLTVVTIYNVDATPTTDGKNVGAAAAADADETKFHVVTSKKTATNLTVAASVTPNVDEVKNKVTWVGATQDGADKMKATISRGTSGRFPVTINVDGNACEQGYVWVAWGTFSSNSIAISSGSCQVTTEDQTTGPGTYITGGYDFEFTINPQTIITDAERPNLSGDKTTAVPGANKTHVVSGNTLAGGASRKWDESRQVRAKILNPHLYPVAQLPSVDGHLWNGQPTAETVPENYPADDAEGNDDTHTNDQDNDPYGAPEVGKLTATDSPTFTFRHSTGSDNDTYQERYHYREFARLEIGSTWHCISDFYLWRIHFKIKRVAGAWQDDASTKALDNAGW